MQQWHIGTATATLPASSKKHKNASALSNCSISKQHCSSVPASSNMRKASNSSSSIVSKQEHALASKQASKQ
jgi:hypothetical protein